MEYLELVEVDLHAENVKKVHVHVHVAYIFHKKEEIKQSTHGWF